MSSDLQPEPRPPHAWLPYLVLAAALMLTGFAIKAATGLILVSLIGLGGLGVSVLLFRLSLSQARARAVAEKIAAELQQSQAELAASEQRSRTLADQAGSSEELHRTVTETAADAIITLDDQGVIRAVNPATERIFGYASPDLIGQPLTVLIPARFRKRHEHSLAAYFGARPQRPGWQGVELLALHRDGHELPVEISFGSYVRNGKPFLTGILRDISDRKRTEEALRETEERFRLVVERTRDYAIFTTDKEGRIATWNPGAERILGYAETEILGQPSSLVFTPEDRAAAVPEREVETALKQGQSADERWHCRKDGSRFWASGVLIALRDGAGHLRGFAKIMRDMTEQKQAQEQIQRLNAELEQRVGHRTAALQDSNEQLEAFTYTVAHDLRAPLRAMQGFSQALLEDYAKLLDNQGRDYVRRVIDAAQRMDGLIQDLLAYSRLSRSQFQPQPENLESALDLVLLAFASEIKHRQAVVKVNRPLPPVLAHPGTLEQVLSNLVSNALTFVAPEVEPRLVIWAEERGGAIRLWFQDNGIGIEAEHQERVFRVFERLHGSESYPGTGIGLAIVRKGVERMGGRVGVESEPGQGSRFWIELRKAS